MSAPFARLNRPIRLRTGGESGRAFMEVPRFTALDTEPVDTDTRLIVWKRDGGRCRNCGSTENLHFDHVIPRSWGGSSDAYNVQVLCRACNLRKGASLVDGGCTN